MTWRRTVRTVVGLLLTLALVAPARARQTPPDPLREINDSLQVPGTKDAAEVLCPALAAMRPPPGAPVGLRKVSLMTSADAEWAAWDSWAAGDSQQAVLTALKTITDPKSKFTFGLKFGRANVAPEWVAAGLFIETGDPPLIGLAVTGMRYLARLDDLALLCTVEAERLAVANKPDECAALLVNWVRFGRMMADRPFAKEKSWGATQIEAALERLGDIACTHTTLFTEKSIQNTNKDLDLRALAPERVRFPIGERMALKQLVALSIDERGGPKPDAFGPTVGRLTADPANAYDLFPQAAYWSEIGKVHAGWFDTRDTIDKVLNDWQKRWELNNIFDPIMKTPTDYSKMDRLKFAMVEALVKDIPVIFNQRTSLVTQLTGTRSAIAVVGYKSVQGQWPPTLPPVQPRFVQKLDDDPWFWEEEREVRDFFRYFVPMRDQPVGPRELPKPHMVRVDLSGSSASLVAEEVTGVAFIVRVALKDLKAIAPGVYDTAAGTLDETKLKERLLAAAKESASRIFSDQDALKALQDGLTSSANTTSEVLMAGLRSMLDAPGAQSALDSEARTHGLTLDELKQFVIKFNEKGDAANAPLLKSMKDGQPLTLEMIEQMLTSHAEALTSPDLLEPYIKKVVAALATPGGVATGPGITATLTEKDFVLYSVGPDMKADYAKIVGRAGPDILIWPPVLTLERRALKGN